MRPEDKELIAAALPSYDIGEEIGSGGFGVVLAAEHRRLHRRVAVKQLLPSLAANMIVQRRFSSEARVLARLDHPHIVHILDYVEDGSLCLLVMEFLSGGTAWDRFATERPDPRVACAIALATSSALDYAHARAILHRDIKPQNLMFSESGTLKVTDFGLAKVLGGEGTMLTTDGDFLGTPAYMAPEQAKTPGQEMTPATDVYGLAASLYELLSGQLPFVDEGGPLVVVYRHVYEQPIHLNDLAPTIPEPIADVVMHNLATIQTERHQTAAEFGVALAHAAYASWGANWLATTGVEIMASGNLGGAITARHEDTTFLLLEQSATAAESAQVQIDNLAMIDRFALDLDSAVQGAALTLRRTLPTDRIIRLIPCNHKSTWMYYITRSSPLSLIALCPDDMVLILAETEPVTDETHRWTWTRHLLDRAKRGDLALAIIPEGKDGYSKIRLLIDGRTRTLHGLSPEDVGAVNEWMGPPLRL